MIYLANKSTKPKPRRIAKDATVHDYLKEFDLEIIQLEKWLKAGWGIEYAKSKSGISSHCHKHLLQDEDYARMIYKYRKFTVAAIDILNAEIEKRKKFLI